MKIAKRGEKPLFFECINMLNVADEGYIVPHYLSTLDIIDFYVITNSEKNTLPDYVSRSVVFEGNVIGSKEQIFLSVYITKK